MMEPQPRPSHVEATELQSAVFDLLADPGTYGLHEPIARIDTHCAAVFLAGPDVYKVKRAVRYPFLDFSTLEQRHAACRAEIEVNLANAPDLYLGVVPITRDAGRLALGGQGEVVEWAVHLRRFDEASTFDRLAAKGPFGTRMIDKIAAKVAAAHRQAPRRDDPSAARRLRAIMVETMEEIAQAPDIFPADASAALGSAMEAAYDQVEPLLLRRAASGLVRRCHGDLHLGNIALIAEEPVLFDAIEFDDKIATCDILYDLAFLLMDLWERNLRQDANYLFNRMIMLSKDEVVQIQGLEALPLFLALRASIRAKVLAARVRIEPEQEEIRARALAYFEAARSFLQAAPPLLLAVGGLSGTGKTAVASAVAPALGRAPGALHLRSDIERKHIFGVADTTRLSSEAYTGEATRRVYDRLRELAQSGLRAGQAVILDATHLQARDREETGELAIRTDAAFTGIWLEAPLPVLLHRVAERVGDASDATPATVVSQAEVEPRMIGWNRLDATQPISKLAALTIELAKRATDARSRSGGDP